MSVSKPLPHDAAALHVSGAARYVDDIPTPYGTLHLAFGISPVAAGTLNSMDLGAVRETPGVIAVLTASDLQHDADCSPSNHDEPLLATDMVHYVGQPLFLVVATSHHIARNATRRAQIDITARDPILTIAQALTANSRFEDGPRVYGRRGRGRGTK